SRLFSSRPPPTPPHSLSLHDALPISARCRPARRSPHLPPPPSPTAPRGPPPRPPSPGDSLHRRVDGWPTGSRPRPVPRRRRRPRSEEHTSELQSRFDLVCRLLLEKKK